MICAGGIGSPDLFSAALKMGYSGAQLGTRFIATRECSASDRYKQAILKATARDIVLTEKISGVPVSVINTPYMARIGTHAGPLARRMLQGRKTKHWMRAIYSLQSIWKLKKAAVQGMTHKDYYQAGKSVEGIEEIEPAGEVVKAFSQVLVEKQR